MKATRQAVVQRALELGVTIEDDGDAIQAMCPGGCWFHGKDVGHTELFIYGDGAWTKPEIWAVLLNEYLSAPLDEEMPGWDADRQ